MKLPSDFWHIKGTKQGPRVLVLGGTHGNELTGIEVVRFFREKFNLTEDVFEATSDMTGDLYLGLGNPLAIKKNSRAVLDGPDLNRSFSALEIDAVPLPSDRPDLVRARELAPLLRKIDYLFDVHATSNPSEPFVCFDTADPSLLALSAVIPVRYILIDPNHTYLQVEGVADFCTTDSFVNRFGGQSENENYDSSKRGFALCYETGEQTDMTRVQQAIAVVGKLLIHTGIVTKDQLDTLGIPYEPVELASPSSVYAISHAEVALHTGFNYAPEMNKAWQVVSKGQLVGHYPNGEPVYIPEDGMYIFPRGAKFVKAGKSLFCIAQLVQK